MPPRPTAGKRPRLATAGDLRRTELFEGVPGRLITRLVQTKKVKLSTLQPRTNLTLRHKRHEYVYIIVSGYLEVRLNSTLIKKGKSFLLAFRGPGQIVGEMSAIARERGVAFISASEPCELIQIPSDALMKLAESNGRIYRNICSLLVKKTRQERRRIEVTLMPEGKPQVAQALLNFLVERGADKGLNGEEVIHGRLRQQDIADYVGCDRTTVAKPLSGLKTKGVIGYPDQGHHKAQRITIFRRGELAEVAQSRNKRVKRINVHSAHTP